MNARKRVVAGAIALGLGLTGLATSAQAAPRADRHQVVTVGCPADVGGFEFVDVIPLGSIAFVLDAEGEATGEKYVVHSLDVAAFTDGGDLVFEFHKVYGQRKGHGEPFSCSGSFPVEPGVTAFFDVLVTRR